MAKVSAEKIWEAVLKDPEMATTPKPVQEACKPFFMAIPEVLKEYLDQPVTLKSLMDAKMAFLKYCSRNGYIKAVIGATSEESLGFFDRDAIADMMESIFASLLETLEEVAKNVPAFLKTQGVTEEQIMTSSNVGFSPAVMKLYKSRKLTIRMLLELQPSVIINNKK